MIHPHTFYGGLDRLYIIPDISRVCVLLVLNLLGSSQSQGDFDQVFVCHKLVEIADNLCGLFILAEERNS